MLQTQFDCFRSEMQSQMTDLQQQMGAIISQLRQFSDDRHPTDVRSSVHVDSGFGSKLPYTKAGS